MSEGKSEFRGENDKNRVFVRLYRGKPRLCAVESDWSA